MLLWLLWGLVMWCVCGLEVFMIIMLTHPKVRRGPEAEILLITLILGPLSFIALYAILKKELVDV
jgi:hypothetical protein